MTVADRCPGVLRPHVAADGMVIRLRVPGGQTTGRVIAEVSELARRFGNPELQLTSRSGLQLRGLTDPVPSEIVIALDRLGFVPSAAHDRVRNIVASPLTGLQPGTADLRALIRDLDSALVADPELADLPGRFLFALDDGTGDVSTLPLDLGYRATGPDAGQVLLGSSRYRIPVDARTAVAVLTGLARDFLACRPATGRHWHVRDLDGWARARAAQVVDSVAAPVETPLGSVAGAASVRVPLGLLTPAQADLVARISDDGAVVLTPFRGLVLPGRADALTQLVDAGLIADEHSGWALVTACVGAPHCRQTTLDTRAAATQLVAAGLEERIHLSGCERRCGSPSVSHVDLVGELVGS